METKNILITGATGNIGQDVIQYLCNINSKNNIIAGVRNIDKAKKEFVHCPQLNYVQFDFEDFSTFDTALKNINRVFLLRPPHISDADKYFKPLIAKIKNKGINEIVFLSVQGVEKSSIIPHNKIEKLIKEHQLGYIFLRPSYFMQNLTTTLISDIQAKHKIILPAGKAKFNWVDVKNIGEVAAMLLNDFDTHKNQAIEITGYENKNFYEVVSILNEFAGTNLSFESINPLRFFKIKRKEGMLTGMIVVMIMLHILPRFQKEPNVSDFFEKLTGKKPTSLEEFAKREQNKFRRF